VIIGNRLHIIGTTAEEVWDIKSNIKLTCESLGIKLQRRSGDVALFELNGLGVEGETQGRATDFRVSFWLFLFVFFYILYYIFYFFKILTVKIAISAISIQDLTPEGVRYRPVMESLGRGNGLHFPPIALTPREKAVTLRPSEWMAIRLVSFDDTRPSWPGYPVIAKRSCKCKSSLIWWQISLCTCSTFCAI